MSELERPQMAEHEVLYVRAGRWQLRLTKLVAGSFDASIIKDGIEPETVITQRVSLTTLLASVLAILIAYVAQFCFDAVWIRQQLVELGQNTVWFDEWHMWLAAGLYLFAMLLFALFAPSLWPVESVDTDDRESGTTRANYGRARVILLVTAVALALINMWLFYKNGETEGSRQRWLFSIALFLAIQPFQWRAVIASLQINKDRLIWLAFLLVMAIGIWLRYTRLDTIPNDLHGDMASYGLEVRKYLLGAGDLRIFREAWADIPFVGYMPYYISMSLFGNNLYGMNMGAFSMSVLTLIGVYLLVLRISDMPRLALITTAVSAINIANIHFARLSAYIDPWPFNIFGFYFLIDGMKSRRYASFALSGILFGFSLLMYYSGRVIIFIVLGFLIYSLLFRRRWITENWLGFLFVALGALVALGPNLVYFSQNTTALLERSRVVFLYYPDVMHHLKGKYQVETEFEVLLEQIRRSLLMFHVWPDQSTQFAYAHPMFSTPISPLIALGFAYCVRRWLRPIAVLGVIYYLCMLVLGAILTGDSPAWMRLVGIVYVAALFVAIAIEAIWRGLAQRSWHPEPKITNASIGKLYLPRATLMNGFAVLIVLWLGWTGWQDWRLYIDTVDDNCRGQACLGRYLSQLPPEVTACSFSNPYELSVRETAFLAYPRVTVDLPENAPENSIEQCPGPPFVWLLTTNHLNWLDVLRREWPNGQYEEHYVNNGSLLFVSYKVDDGRKTASQPISPLALPATSPSLTGSMLHAVYPNGELFVPVQSFQGDLSVTPIEYDAGIVTVKGGKLLLDIAPLPGQDAVYDYVRVVAENGSEVKFEAEDTTTTTGDTYTPTSAIDNHWWLQSYSSFSNQFGLVAQKQEAVPVLRTTIPLQDGDYHLYLGSFTGDSNNGVFGLGLRVVETPPQ
ncbi:MAG: glycosyltransferase family 39 protein [Caldilineaceae bacterium]